MIRSFVKKVLKEDEGRGDLFAQVFPSKKASAKVIAKSDGVFAGEVYLKELAKITKIELNFLKKDSDTFVKGDVLLEVNGSSHKLLKLERTLLNMLLHASSIATNTYNYVQKIAKYDVKLLDTRKTRPLLRTFEKYAVRVGGGVNHRLGIDDCLMLKDTHLKTITDLNAFMKEARQKIPFTSKIEIECEDFTGVKKAFEAGADIVMLDNMKPEQIIEIVAYRNAHFKHILLEVSGNVTLENIESYAVLGIDAISSGSLVHQANWIDISMKMN